MLFFLFISVLGINNMFGYEGADLFDDCEPGSSVEVM